MPTTPTTEDLWITLPGSAQRMYARRWQPNNANAHSRAPIVLMHDSLGAVVLWRDFPALLAQATGRVVIAYDRLGFGQSDARQGPPSAAFISEEATHYWPALRDQLQLTQFVLLGHSVGGGMAIESAARAGTACTALITIAAQAFVGEGTVASISAARSQFQDPEQIARLAKYHGDKARWVVDAWTETWLSQPFADWNNDAWLQQLQTPALVLHGEHDEYGDRSHPDRIAHHAGTHAQVALIPGAHHMPHREVPDVVLAHIRQFLQDKA